MHDEEIREIEDTIGNHLTIMGLCWQRRIARDKPITPEFVKVMYGHALPLFRVLEKYLNERKA